ncbi:hypothetical protein Goklo_029154 [Gossypium klotzschianum]|uniref:Uncharacterized protein n=1 Tax=Gossypium klotzschianum TaxID=34286 RepID=A0A7J8WDR5_9ROSI|nr:hypothetical protein [Gossypium klotzschianum]
MMWRTVVTLIHKVSELEES